jgi:hypothetical protein
LENCYICSFSPQVISLNLQHFPVLLVTYLAGKMPAPQEFYGSTLYLIGEENSVYRFPVS